MERKFNLDLLSAFFMKLFLFIALFCPISTTMKDNKYMPYYQEFLLVNAVIAVFMVLYLASTWGQKRWKKENKIFCIKYFVAIGAYLFFYWLMYEHIQWKWEGLNACVSFGFFLLMMSGKNKEWIDEYHIIEFANGSIIISNLIGIMVYLKGYASVYWYNFKLQFLLPQANYFYERRFNWIYYHKSQYAFMLLLSLAFILTYRHKFKNKFIFCFSVAELMVCLFISHVNAAIVGGGLLFGSFLLDLIIKNFKKINKAVFVVGIPVCLGAVFSVARILFLKIAAERSVTTLGSRTFIWKNVGEYILAHPEGMGNKFAVEKIVLPDAGDAFVNNGHNIFLNEMLRFSLPVGICFVILFALIIIYSLEKKFSVFTLGIWGAVMMSVNMDYAVMASGWTLMLFFFYMIFFLEPGKGKTVISDIEVQNEGDIRKKDLRKTGKHEKR